MNREFEASVTALADRLKKCRQAAKHPFLMALDGRSGVGKSTFARALSEQLEAGLITTDDFYAGGIGIREESPQDLAEACINRTRLSTVLSALKANQPAAYAPFDWAAFNGTLADEKTHVQPHPILVLEGVYANHPDLHPLIDFSVLLWVPEADRLRRLTAREGAITDWERQWHRAEDWYFAHLARPETFDAVICNT